jgi:hypothetical protein
VLTEDQITHFGGLNDLIYRLDRLAVLVGIKHGSDMQDLTCSFDGACLLIEEHC